MAELSGELLNNLTEFMVCEIGSKIFDGITYALLFKGNKKDEELRTKYLKIRDQLVQSGFSSNEKLRFYEISNGYIFDMDISIAKRITLEIAKLVSEANGGQTPVIEMVKDMPDQRRKRDLVSLAKYLKSEYDKGNKQVEVALFSRNSTNKIIINGKAPNGELVSLRYNAYAIRHWDVEIINEKFLIPSGFRIKSIQPCEILPSKTGVSFLFTMESMDEYSMKH